MFSCVAYLFLNLNASFIAKRLFNCQCAKIFSLFKISVTVGVGLRKHTPSCTAAPKQLKFSLPLFTPWQLFMFLIIHLFISIFVLVAVVVHAICIWSRGADCGGKFWVIVPLEMQNNRGRPGCFQKHYDMIDVAF